MPLATFVLRLEALFESFLSCPQQIERTHHLPIRSTFFNDKFITVRCLSMAPVRKWHNSQYCVSVCRQSNSVFDNWVLRLDRLIKTPQGYPSWARLLITIKWSRRYPMIFAELLRRFRATSARLSKPALCLNEGLLSNASIESYLLFSFDWSSTLFIKRVTLLLFKRIVNQVETHTILALNIFRSIRPCLFFSRMLF